MSEAETQPKVGEEGFSLIENANNLPVGLLDLDGTLSEPFTMRRFVEAMHANNLGNGKIRGELIEAFEQWEKGTYKGKYYEFIDRTGKLYGKMLEGVPLTEIQDFGHKWSLDGGDAKRHLYDYSRPLVELLQKIGITPTLVTGTPMEGIQGFRDILGIRERCYALEAEINDKGHYTGVIKHNTGLPHAKYRVAEKMLDRGHCIVFAAGDQISDGALIDAALNIGRRETDVHGCAILINAPTELVENTQLGTTVGAVSEMRLKIIERMIASAAVIEEVQSLLLKVVKDRENAGLLQDVRAKVFALFPQQAQPSTPSP